jgi:hypothetical protein
MRGQVTVSAPNPKKRTGPIRLSQPSGGAALSTVLACPGLGGQGLAS